MSWLWGEEPRPEPRMPWCCEVGGVGGPYCTQYEHNRTLIRRYFKPWRWLRRWLTLPADTTGVK